MHSAHALAVSDAFAGERPRADALVTDRAGLVLGALSADCAPILLADPEARVVAAVHAGWRGAMGGIAEAALATMAALGARFERTVAVVGPCIGPESYEVGEDFLRAFEHADPAHAAFFAPGRTPGKRQFDRPALVISRPHGLGVRRAEWIGADTCADEGRWFSNRRATHRSDGDYGRLLSAIALV